MRLGTVRFVLVAEEVGVPFGCRAAIKERGHGGTAEEVARLDGAAPALIP